MGEPYGPDGRSVAEADREATGRTDIPYVITFLIGALLGGGLLFFLAPGLKPTPVVAVPSRGTGPGETSRPKAVEVKGRNVNPRRAVALGAKRPAQPRQDRSGSAQQGQRVRSDRPASLAQPTPRRASPVPRVVRVPGSPLDAGGQRYIIHVGPIAEQKRTVEIVRHLALAGFDFRVASREEARPSHFQVVSETVPLAVAERRALALAQLGFHPQVRTLAAGLAQLRFGGFVSRQEAEGLAARVRNTGHTIAAVVRERGTGYVIILGPHSQDTIDLIHATLRSRFLWVLPVTVTLAD